MNVIIKPPTILTSKISPKKFERKKIDYENSKVKSFPNITVGSSLSKIPKRKSQIFNLRSGSRNSTLRSTLTEIENQRKLSRLVLVKTQTAGKSGYLLKVKIYF